MQYQKDIAFYTHIIPFYKHEYADNMANTKKYFKR